MEDRPSSPMLHLDLNNFDTGDAEGSRYVLTSPRSLEACARLGFKPVQLLHKSLASFVDDHRNVSLGEVTLLYEVHEKERRRLLRRCREERERIIVEGTEHNKSRKNDAGAGTSSGPKNAWGHKTGSELSADGQLKTECKSLKPERTHISPALLTVSSLGDLRHTPATERKLQTLEREIRRATRVMVPEKDRKIAALMLAKHEEEQRRLRQSRREEEQREEAQRREQRERLRAERERRKERQRDARRWQAGLEARRRQREREEALRVELRERETGLEEERWRRQVGEREREAQEAREAARREAQERKRGQEHLLCEREREALESRERESQVAAEKEARASRSRAAQEKSDRRRLQQENQRQELRHLLLKQAANDQALAEEAVTRSAMEARLHGARDSRERAASNQRREREERQNHEEEQREEAPGRAGWKEAQEQRQKEAQVRLGERRRDRATRIAREQQEEKARRARHASREKQRSHSLLLQRRREEEERLQEQRERGVACKEGRREQLRRQKEAALREARCVARASFQMRERVREHTHGRPFHLMDQEAQLCASLDRVQL